MSATPREVGTLVVVILKAQHLPNKQRIGKQDPYCCVTLNGERRRTRAIKRGGQHPEWDEEVRFTLFEDTEDILARTGSESSSSIASSTSVGGGEGLGGAKSGTPPLPPPKEQEGKRRKKKVKGGNAMHIACFADDPKEPELIGETVVDLTEVLTKGETDEWFTLTNKDKFSGEVYLELTFWSNERPPEKKNKSGMMRPNKQYGGPGSFVPSESDSSFGSVDSRSSISGSLRPASSLAQLDLYRPPYEQTIRSQGTGRTPDQLADEFGGLNVGHGRRRESYPPPRTGHTPAPSNSTYSSFSTSTSYHSNGYGSEGYDSGYDTAATPVLHAHRHSFGEPGQAVPVYQSPYDTGTAHSAGYPGTRARSVSTMYSVPSASSGFASVTTPTQSSFTPVQMTTHAPSGFMPPAQTPVPPGYPPQPAQTPVQYGYGPPPLHTSGPSGFVPPQSAMGYHQPPVPPVQTYPAYQQYPAPASAPPGTYPPGPPSVLPAPPHSAPPQQYGNAPSPQHSNIAPQQFSAKYPPKTPSPPQQYQPPAPLQTTPGSRPLPTPGQKNGMHPATPPHVPMPVPPQLGGSPTPTGQSVYTNTPPHMQPVQHYQQTQMHPQPLPVPPGPPSQMLGNATGPPLVMQQQQNDGFVPPPPPPPLNTKLPGPPPAPSVQVYHQQTTSDPQTNGHGHGNSPIRPPLPQPPTNGIANGGIGMNFNPPIQTGLISQPHPPPPASGSVFQPPPPPPPLPNRRVVSTPHHPLPHPPAPAPPMPQIPGIPAMPSMPGMPQQQRGVYPGEIFNANPGPPPRPPVQVAYQIWHPPAQAQ